MLGCNCYFDQGRNSSGAYVTNARITSSQRIHRNARPATIEPADSANTRRRRVRHKTHQQMGNSDPPSPLWQPSRESTRNPGSAFAGLAINVTRCSLIAIGVKNAGISNARTVYGARKFTFYYGMYPLLTHIGHDVYHVLPILRYSRLSRTNCLS